MKLKVFMKFKALMCLLIVPFIFSGCAKKNTENLYLSIVTEPISQDFSGDEMSIYCYDFKTKEVKKVIDLNKDDFKNPVYSKKDNAILYLKENSDNPSFVDLYSMNVDTKESRQLTEGMKIDSEIIPAKEEIYFASYVNYKNKDEDVHNRKKPCTYNKNTGKVKMFFENNDLKCDKMIYDPVSDHLYAKCASSEESSSEKESYKGYIMDFYKDLENPKQLIKSNEKECPFLVSTIPGEDEIYMWLDRGDKLESTPSIYNPKDNSYNNIEYYAEVTFLGKNVILTDSLIGYPAEIETYNLETKERNKLFNIEDQKLISFKLLSK